MLNEGEWKSGAQVAIRNGSRWLCGTLIHEADDKVEVKSIAEVTKILD